jgi:hypothetical protein
MPWPGLWFRFGSVTWPRFRLRLRSVPWPGLRLRLGSVSRAGLGFRFRFRFRRTQESFCIHAHRIRACLFPDVVRKRPETHRERGARLGLFLGLVRKIQILNLAFAKAGLNLLLQLFGEFALLLNGRQNRGAPLIEPRVIKTALVDVLNLDLIEIARGFLAITRNKRNRGPAFQ